MDIKDIDVKELQVQKAVEDLISLAGGDPSSFNGGLIAQLIETGLKMIEDGHETGQLKLINRSLKEMRYAYRVFNAYKGIRRISIFGSARTPEDHGDYLAAKAFGAAMAKHEWMCITGAANGIMKAGLEGSSRESSFGLSIRLPFEIPTNTIIDGDPKLIVFRYFFTRKLMFMSHSDAVAVFPGGFGTLDELFEVLTLIQTGKSNIMPVVLVEGKGGGYWRDWLEYVQLHLLSNGWICEADQKLYYIASDVEDAVHHIMKFYHRYHSSRYVDDLLVIRLLESLKEEQVAFLNEKYRGLVMNGGRMEMSKALEGETDHLDLPRLIFPHTKFDFGKVRALIDDINAF